MTEDTREMDQSRVEMADNHVDISMEMSVPPEHRAYAEIRCDCDRWVEFVVGNVTVECECGEVWTLKAAKVNDE